MQSYGRYNTKANITRNWICQQSGCAINYGDRAKSVRKKTFGKIQNKMRRSITKKMWNTLCRFKLERKGLGLRFICAQRPINKKKIYMLQ